MTYSLRSAEQANQTTIREEWGTLIWLASHPIGNAEDMTVGRTILKPGQSNPRHSHPNCDEVLYVLKGQLKHAVRDEWLDLKPGDTLTIPQGTPHQATNTGDENCDVIVVYNSGDRIFKLEEG